MKLFVTDTYEAMSKQAADEVIRLMESFDKPLICTASGDSPAGIYKEINRRVLKKELDTRNWFFVGLDEWVGMNGKDEGSCRFHLDQELFHPLQVAGEKICFFDGRVKDLELECRQVENFIRQQGGIDVAILGLGMNGHLGMNEPGTPAALRSHIAALDPVTQKVGQKYFKNQQALSQGITLGLATIMEARHIILLVSGRHKAEIVQQVLESDISELLPATILRKHPAVKMFLDGEAASKMIQF